MTSICSQHQDERSRCWKHMSQTMLERHYKCQGKLNEYTTLAAKYCEYAHLNVHVPLESFCRKN